MDRQTRQLLVITAALAVMFSAFAFAIEGFAARDNLANIARRGAINGIISAGMTLVILTGGIDLSVGSVLALSGVCLALAMKAWGLAAGLCAGLGAGVLCGLFNGLFVVFGRVPPFITTLGMMGIAHGIALRATGGRTVHGLPPTLTRVMDVEILGVQPVPGLLALAVLLGGQAFLSFTTWGRYLIAIGCNERASRLSGVPVERVKLGVYVAAGACAALAGVLQVAKLNSGSPLVGEGYELSSIAAVILGGTSIMGGRGSIVGTLVGVLIIAVLASGLTQLNVQSQNQNIIIGALIIATVLVDQLTRRGREP